jgi:hypothetical protein
LVLGIHCPGASGYVKVAFFRGTSLRPLPPGESKQKEVRYLDIPRSARVSDPAASAFRGARCDLAKLFMCVPRLVGSLGRRRREKGDLRSVGRRGRRPAPSAIHEDDPLDEAQFAAWVKRASQLPGERL